jgi:hypothetical protein
MLYSNDLQFLNNINSNLQGVSTADPNLSIMGNRRVGKGRIAILWNKC